MKENDIMKLYKRYVQSLGRQDADVCKNYQALGKKLMTDFSENPLKQEIEADALHRALQVVKQRNIRLKELSESSGYEWSRTLINECYKKLDKIQKALEEGDTDRFAILVHDYVKFSDNVTDNPYQQMYFWLKYSDTDFGKWLLRRDGDEAFKHINLLLQQEVVDSSVELSETEAEAAQT